VAFDYGQPRAALTPREQLAFDSLASRVQLAGEAFQLFFTPRKVASELAAFYELEDLGSPEINQPLLRPPQRRPQTARQRRPAWSAHGLEAGLGCEH
jgi:hypothetical protein